TDAGGLAEQVENVRAVAAGDAASLALGLERLLLWGRRLPGTAPEEFHDAWRAVVEAIVQ
ncbi:MAG TPA: hypothetical protein VEL28_00195, partial [Candidatus Binatia bacterium]|nr:hypothetical protein [Candidatus Binatia bacterium]